MFIVGTYVWFEEGKKYTGNWKVGKMDGKGKFEWKDGKKYNGQYIEGKKQGFGIMNWPSGIRYEGDWSQGRQHGPGKLFDKEGNLVSEGRWENGILSQQ